MNWMIDGAYGNLYRDAMGYSPLTPAIDEWDVERKTKARPGRRLRGWTKWLSRRWTPWKSGKALKWAAMPAAGQSHPAL